MSTSSNAIFCMWGLRLRRFLNVPDCTFTTADGEVQPGCPDIHDRSNHDVVSIRNSRGDIIWQSENISDALPSSLPTLVRQNGYIVDRTSRSRDNNLAPAHPSEPVDILHQRVGLVAALSFLSCVQQYHAKQPNINRKEDPDASAGVVPVFAPVLVR